MGVWSFYQIPKSNKKRKLPQAQLPALSSSNPGGATFVVCEVEKPELRWNTTEEIALRQERKAIDLSIYWRRERVNARRTPKRAAKKEKKKCGRVRWKAGRYVQRVVKRGKNRFFGQKKKEKRGGVTSLTVMVHHGLPRAVA